MEEYVVRVYEDRTEWLQEWRQNDKLHRTGGPAIEWANGNKFWYQNDKLHRTDGPAIELADGTKEYFIEDEEYTEEEFLKKTQSKVEELTVAEISKRLGCEVKIVKE
jgi:hypothetical protein